MTPYKKKEKNYNYIIEFKVYLIKLKSILKTFI